jgi:hypothetical protein
MVFSCGEAKGFWVALGRRDRERNKVKRLSEEMLGKFERGDGGVAGDYFVDAESGLARAHSFPIRRPLNSRRQTCVLR